MFICKNCGEKYHGNYGTCGKCGGSIFAYQEAPLPPPQQPPNIDSVRLHNPWTRETKEVPAGFSWWVLFLGFIYIAYLGSWKWSAFSLLAALCTAGVSNIVFPFFFSELFIKDLIAAGFRPADAMSDTIIRSKGIFIPYP